MKFFSVLFHKICPVIMVMLFGFSGRASAGDLNLIAGYHLNNPPKSFMENRELKGIIIDIVDLLTPRLRDRGITIQLAGSYPFARIEHLMKNNRIQLYFGASKSPDREKVFSFSRTPLYNLRLVFAHQFGQSFDYTGQASLRGKRVGTIRGTYSSQLIKEMPDVMVEEVASVTQNFEKLIRGRIDLIFYHNLGLGWERRNEKYAGRVSFAKTPLRENQHYVIYTRQVPRDVIDTIDAEVLKLKKEGAIGLILQRYGIQNNTYR